MSFTQFYTPDPDTAGHPSQIYAVSLGIESTFTSLDSDPQVKIVTFFSGSLRCDAGPSGFLIVLNDGRIFETQAQTNETFFVFEVAQPVMWVINPGDVFTIETPALPSGASFLDLELTFFGYQLGLSV